MTTRQQAEPSVATQRVVAAGTTTGSYKPTWAPLRPGADQHEQIPSLRAGKRQYRDGRRELA